MTCCFHGFLCVPRDIFSFFEFLFVLEDFVSLYCARVVKKLFLNRVSVSYIYFSCTINWTHFLKKEIPVLLKVVRLLPVSVVDSPFFSCFNFFFIHSMEEPSGPKTKK